MRKHKRIQEGLMLPRKADLSIAIEAAETETNTTEYMKRFILDAMHKAMAKNQGTRINTTNNKHTEKVFYPDQISIFESKDEESDKVKNTDETRHELYSNLKKLQEHIKRLHTQLNENDPLTESARSSLEKWSGILEYVDVVPLRFRQKNQDDNSQALPSSLGFEVKIRFARILIEGLTRKENRDQEIDRLRSALNECDNCMGQSAAFAIDVTKDLLEAIQLQLYSYPDDSKQTENFGIVQEYNATLRKLALEKLQEERGVVEKRPIRTTGFFPRLPGLGIYKRPDSADKDARHRKLEAIDELIRLLEKHEKSLQPVRQEGYSALNGP